MEAHYTLRDANRLLPLLHSIAGEIEDRRAERQRLIRIREDLEAANTPEGLQQSLADLDARIFELHSAIRTSVSELEGLELTVLRLNPVTIHIPGRTQRGPIVFCWQPGEERICHGHMLGEEDDPRRPLKVHTTTPHAHG